MISNYFLLYHSTKFSNTKESLLLNFNDKDFDKIAAFILTLDLEKIEGYLELEEFKKLCKKVIINGFLDSSTFYEFCFLALQRIQADKDLSLLYIEVFNYLNSKSLVAKHDFDKLLAIFEPLSIEVEHIDTKENDFLQNKEFVVSSLEKTKELADSQSLIDNLYKLQEYINKQTFSIGITGVMNVGKSTFINALLSNELLGSSVVAETANLSVIKYSAEPYTKVRFFNTNEFDEMLHTFDDEQQKKKYLFDLESSIDLQNYIKEDSFSIDIRRQDLHKYTSASDDSGLCHIVKDVELGVDLEFLKDSIEIVDTPGLDDSLIVRESVTQGYVRDCDLLIHLMNVNQSASQKDVDFIIECVVNQDVNSILILLTKADNISKKELDEVVEYTKSSIQNQLASLGNDSNVLKVLSSLKFLSISAKTALDIRKVNEQDKYMNSIQKSGILEVEAHLHETLFSKNTKNEQIIETSINRLKDIIKQQIKIYNYNLELYSKNEESLELELKSFNDTKEQNQFIYKKIDTQINSEYEEFIKYINSLNLDMDNETRDLKLKLLGRVVDEIKYSLQKDKAQLKDFQLKMIIEKSLNHGFIDIVREHKYRLEKKVNSINENIELSFKSHNIRVEQTDTSFSLQELFEKNSNSILSTNTKMILKDLLLLIKNIKLSKMDSFKEEFSLVLDKEFEFIKVHMLDTLKELNDSIAKDFFTSLRLPIQRLEDELKEYENSLEKQIFLLKDRDEDIEQLQINTQNRINSMKVISEGL